MSDQYTPGSPRRGRPPASIVEAAEPSRPSRQDETRKRRRNRDLLGPERNLKLYVPPDQKDPNFEYRWVNDRPGRVRQMTQYDDWDVVSGIDPSSSAEGTVTTRIVDSGAGEKGVLLRKPKEYYDEDRAEAEKALKARDDELRQGASTSPEGLSGPQAYVPGGRNQIG